MGFLNDVWNWTKDAAEWVYDAVDDVLEVIADVGDEVAVILGRLGFGKKQKDQATITNPGTWPSWIWIALAGVGAVFILPRVIRALK